MSRRVVLVDKKDNKVGLMNFRAKKPFAILIEDKDLAETLKTVWQNLWDRL